MPPLGPVMAANASTPVAMHNELLGTDPQDGARLGAGPARVTLIFDLPPQRGFSTIIVTGPDGNQWQAGPATEDGTTVSAPVRPLGPVGDYTVAWRIISADGHPVRATLRFTLTTPGPGTAAAPPPTAGRSGSAMPAADTGSARTPGWPWLAGAGALLVAGVVMALRANRPRG
ncbi:MAG: copper resistance CopC family protein [Pseudonocardiaceae bacterium]